MEGINQVRYLFSAIKIQDCRATTHPMESNIFYFRSRFTDHRGLCKDVPDPCRELFADMSEALDLHGLDSMGL